MTGIYMAGNRVLIDTGVFIALSFRRDQNHQKAAKIFQEMNQKGVYQVTTNLIVAETYAFLRYNVNYATCIDFLSKLKAAEMADKEHKLEVIYSTAEIEEEAVKVLQKFYDQDISYVDAVSFAVLLKRLEIKDIFTFDGHFYLINRNVVGVS